MKPGGIYRQVKIDSSIYHVVSAGGLSFMAAMSNQCLAAGAPFFFKERGGLNRKKARCLSDGRTWDDMWALCLNEKVYGRVSNPPVR
ncbi:MAG: hypothetical protein HWN68_17215 [Desulfobacterales bacterium]|nr:hypothetical protein [Desulfobacterales bacterium]